MNAITKPAADLLQQTGQLSESVTRPIPGSRKIFVEGSRPDLQVAMREIAQTQTPTLFGGETNPPITVYDPSGPYTDPDARIDLSEAPHLQDLLLEYDADPERFAGFEQRHTPVYDDNPFYIRDYNKCINCWRCVQVCAEDAQYTFALNFDGRGFHTTCSAEPESKALAVRDRELHHP